MRLTSGLEASGALSPLDFAQWPGCIHTNETSWIIRLRTIPHGGWRSNREKAWVSENCVERNQLYSISGHSRVERAKYNGHPETILGHLSSKPHLEYAIQID